MGAAPDPERRFAREAVTLEASRTIADAIVSGMASAADARHAATILLSGAVRIMLDELGYPETAAQLHDIATIVESNGGPGEAPKWN